MPESRTPQKSAPCFRLPFRSFDVSRTRLNINHHLVALSPASNRIRLGWPERRSKSTWTPFSPPQAAAGCFERRPGNPIRSRSSLGLSKWMSAAGCRKRVPKASTDHFGCSVSVRVPRRFRTPRRLNRSHGTPRAEAAPADGTPPQAECSCRRAPHPTDMG